MKIQIRERLKELWTAHRFYILWLAVMGLVLAVTCLLGKGGLGLFVGAVVLFLYAFRPNGALQTMTAETMTCGKRWIAVVTAALTIAVCVWPMGWFPYWNGEIPHHRNQYELTAEAFLDGRLYLEYGDEHELEQLKNPYDPEERENSGVTRHWDHAYYEGRYYMYFGVVPVLLLFLPYRALTGVSLTTYHATQIFVAATILCFFVLFRLLSKLFFKKLPYGIYLLLCVAASFISVWLIVAEPALYCTAISAGICLQLWSIYFFIRAVWVETTENKQLALAGVGALLGALVFGCRPTIALANLLVVPMLIVFLRQRKFSAKLLGKLVLAALPYVIVAVGLMLYNAARFDNPFEFGQRYQLTVADQRNLGVSLATIDLLSVVEETAKLFLVYKDISYIGMFVKFPLLLCTAAFLHPAVFRKAREHRLILLMIVTVLTALIIILADILWSPYLIERYQMDLLFLLTIPCFLGIGLYHDVCPQPKKKWLLYAVAVLAGLAVLAGVFYYIRVLSYYYADEAEAIFRLLFFWNR